MAGSVSTTSSSLASELLLNKIMNGQVQTSTGQSITAAGRAVANRLSSTAYEMRTAEKNMVYGESLASAAQSEVTGLKDMLISMKKNLIDANNNDGAVKTDFVNMQTALKEGFAQYSAAMSAAAFNGTKLFATAAKTQKLNAGNGLTLSLLGDKLMANATVMTTLKAKLVSASITGKTSAGTAKTAIEAAIGVLEGYEAKYGESIKALQNRQILLADEGASLDGTAAAQSVAGLSGASNLLSSMLGETKA